MSILVTHPGRQHAHQLTHALYRAGLLDAFWTGVPTAAPATKGPLYRLLARASPQPTTELPGAVVRHFYVAPLVRRAAGALCAPPQAAAWRHRGQGWFDRWCAARLPATPDAVVCYENAARDTFRRAKQQGAATILDAASFHHEWQDAVYEPLETEAVHAAINARKDEEIALADHILTVSELARDSYVKAGVPPQQVTAVPMGADLAAFQRSGERHSARKAPAAAQEEGDFTFLFAGHASHRKGVDVLLAASRRLQENGHAHRVQFAGGAEPGLFEDAPPAVEPLGYLDRDELAATFQRADCLVLPSRHDSFGRVVVEAMATGLPVLLSEHVGAKAAVEDGDTGWVVPAEDAEALAERMAWCVRHPEAVAEKAPAAAQAAQAYSWAAYHERVVDVLRKAVA